MPIAQSYKDIFSFENLFSYITVAYVVMKVFSTLSKILFKSTDNNLDFVCTFVFINMEKEQWICGKEYFIYNHNSLI